MPRSTCTIVKAASPALVMVLLTGPACFADPTPRPEAPGPTTGYPTVAAALAGLHAKAGVVFSEQRGWTIADDDSAMTIWSFAPPGDPAYPAVVKRELIKKGDGIYVHMSVLCEAPKPACDNLVHVFEQLNAQAAASLHNGN